MKLLAQQSLEAISGGILVDFRTAHNITDPSVFTPCVMVEGDWSVVDGQKKFVPTPHVSVDFQTLGEILSQG
jgi:hypothetical protein